MDKDDCLIQHGHDLLVMCREIRYKVDVFEVVFVEAPANTVRPFESVKCECEEYSKLSAQPLVNGEDEKCRHIREAELYHIYRQRVSLVE